MKLLVLTDYSTKKNDFLNIENWRRDELNPKISEARVKGNEPYLSGVCTKAPAS
jgi:hypothetical protein